MDQRLPQPTVLVAPLDWGLGHATRCIPIIRQLLQRGCTVYIAAEGKIEHLLRTEFPQLPFLPLQGYRVRYATTGWGLAATMLGQLPRLLKKIKEERTWLQQTVNRYGIDAVISDNRYGLHHPGVFSVLITHQLQVQTPWGKVGNALVQRLLYPYINRFDACWVPDYAAAPGLGGALSHPAKLPRTPVTYTGPLSRFDAATEPLQHYILVLLSGPEPQRTLLEQKLLAQAKAFGQPVLFVRGLPGTVGLPQVPYHINIVNHLSANAMQQALEGAQFVIARTGYTTVMELMALRKRGILIPTPGQTEQQYLARLLMQQNRALCIAQHKFDLEKAVLLAKNFAYQFPHEAENNALHEAIDHLLAQTGKQHQNISNSF